MNAFLVVGLAWAAVAAFCIVRLDRLAHRWIDVRTQQPGIPSPVEVPPDLVALAMGESEKWAQDATLKTIRERFDVYGDWNKVRAAVGVGEVA